jgi:hypothetical protein
MMITSNPFNFLQTNIPCKFTLARNIILSLIIVLKKAIITVTNINNRCGETAMNEKFTKYLFCYFTGNEPERERVCFAVSNDGYHFKPLNGGNPIIKQKTGTLSMRDPYLLRANDGGFYIIATDMKSSLGWDSNHGMVSWKSDDLINWYDECATDFHQYNSTKFADKIWAPQACFDSEKGEYFVYYSVHNTDSEKPISIWYSYTKDFKSFSEPQELFSPKSGKDAIDADIVKINGKYFMCYKDECVKTVCQVVADNLTGPYYEFEQNKIACTSRPVEGNCLYKLINQNKYVMIMDLYCDNRYFMQETDDMMDFYALPPEKFSLNFTPRHGSIIYITDDEYEKLVNQFGF